MTNDYDNLKLYPLVSIIVPVYKVEKYLKDCVDSVRNQTYNNLEIILVDDGSPDNCGQMCDQYAAEDPRVRVVHKRNGGLSDARNAGMASSNGDYLCFVDSDDVLNRNAAQVMLKYALENKADLVCASHLPFVDGTTPDYGKIGGSARSLERLPAIEQFVQKDWGAWGKLYRREIHDGISFPTGKIHEDEAIMLQILDRCDRIVCIDDVLYGYRQREGSITSSAYSEKKMDWMEAWISNVEFAQAKYPTAYLPCLSKAWTVAMYNIGHLLGNADMRHHLAMIAEFASNHYRDLLCNPYISLSGKIRAVVFHFSDIHRDTCLYSHVYGLVDILRGKKRV